MRIEARLLCKNMEAVIHSDPPKKLKNLALNMIPLWVCHVHVTGQFLIEMAS